MRFEREIFFYTMEHLKLALDEGFDQVVFPRDRSCYGIADIVAVQGKREADEFAAINGDWYVKPLKEFLGTMLQVRTNRPLPAIIETGYYYHKQLNKSDMNLNNRDNLVAEMEKLGFDKPLIEKMEEQMKADQPTFKLFDRVHAAKGPVDITLHFKQSGQSDFYYLTRLEAVNNQGRVLEEGEQYKVLIKDAEGKTNSAKPLDSFAEAVEFFKKQTGDAMLAITKGKNVTAEIATMEAGKVNYVNNAFKREYNSPPMSQTFWLDYGKGFNREQAANLVQGRSVYRDDLLSRDGNPYKAWIQLDTDKPRDRHDNLSLRQFSDAYGYDVKTQLDEYKIAEMEDPKKAAHYEQVLKNGGRPMITVEKDGQPTKMFIETSVRYGKLNFYAENGKPEKREQFLKETGLEKVNGLDNKNEKSKEKETAQAQGMSM